MIVWVVFCVAAPLAVLGALALMLRHRDDAY